MFHPFWQFIINKFFQKQFSIHTLIKMFHLFTNIVCNGSVDLPLIQICGEFLLRIYNKIAKISISHPKL